jgi:hypothetical protein
MQNGLPAIGIQFFPGVFRICQVNGSRKSPSSSTANRRQNMASVPIALQRVNNHLANIAVFHRVRINLSWLVRDARNSLGISDSMSFGSSSKKPSQWSCQRDADHFNGIAGF